MTEALAGVVFVPMAALFAVIVLPQRFSRPVAILGLLLWPAFLVPLTSAVVAEGAVTLALGGWPAPLGIGWRVDGLALVLLWLNAAVALAGAARAASFFTGGRVGARTYWPLWLLLVTGINAALVSADLFNLYVGLELITLVSVALIATEDTAAALRGAMRYLLLGVLGSLFYLLGVGLVYSQTGSLALAAPMTGELDRTALVLMLTGLMVKAAVFPLHVWLPDAYGQAPGPVGALLAAVAGKVALVTLWRVWFVYAPDGSSMMSTMIGVLAAVAIVYGSIAAMVQTRLKRVVAYSSVAQVGFLMLLLPLSGTVAFQGAGFHLLAHGFAKGAMFLAAANILAALGTDSVARLSALDRRMPLEAFALALAGVTLVGLPPTGGFIGKWRLLEAAWAHAGWGWMVVILSSGLLSAAYVFRILAMTCFHPAHAGNRAVARRPPAVASLAALLLALAGVAIGLFPAPILALLVGAAPEGVP
jgi:proton-translocating NADH-quinone oxidoreductase chain N